jgi:hypothetical protein
MSYAPMSTLDYPVDRGQSRRRLSSTTISPVRWLVASCVVLLTACAQDNYKLDGKVEVDGKSWQLSTCTVAKSPHPDGGEIHAFTFVGEDGSVVVFSGRANSGTFATAVGDGKGRMVRYSDGCGKVTYKLDANMASGRVSADCKEADHTLKANASFICK